jgi:riboflavin synthase
MFTGIVQFVGRVSHVESTSAGRRVMIDASGWEYLPTKGDSIAVNGCCLTVAQVSSAGLLGFDVIHQTLNVTTLGSLNSDDAVNLEQAVTPSTVLGGHIVQGHVDGVGIVMKATEVAGDWRLRVEPPAALMDTIVERGSIALEGVSLTIAAAGLDWFEVALIPTTLQLTNLARLRQGSRVNLEADYIAKIVVNWLERRRGDK